MPGGVIDVRMFVVGRLPPHEAAKQHLNSKQTTTNPAKVGQIARPVGDNSVTAPFVIFRTPSPPPAARFPVWLRLSPWRGPLETQLSPVPETNDTKKIRAGH